MLLRSWTEACKGINADALTNCPRDASMIMPPPTLKIAVIIEVKNEIAPRIKEISRDIKVLIYLFKKSSK